jgi:protein SCO1
MVERTGDGSPLQGRQGGTPASDAEASSRPRRSGPRFLRPLVLALLGVVAAAAVVFLIRPAPPSASVVSSGEAAIGGPFHLVDVNGRPVDQRVLDGKWSAVFFGYTNCPDTCPATLQALNAAGQALGAARGRFQVVFISVDPQRDTPQEMKLYASSQGYPAGGLIGLTGAPAEVKRVADEYHAFYAKAGSGPDYAVQHSAAVYLMNPRGRFVKPLSETDPPAALAAQIKAAIAA